MRRAPDSVVAIAVLLSLVSAAGNLAGDPPPQIEDFSPLTANTSVPEPASLEMLTLSLALLGLGLWRRGKGSK